MTVLAIDQGSSGTKVAIVDLDGTVLALASRPTEVRHPTVVAAEADPETWWTALVACVREVGAVVPLERVEAVGLCGFMHTLVPTGRDGTAVGPAILWPDQRPATVTGDVSRSTVERLRWWTAEDPAAARTVRWYLPVKDFLRFKLTGVAATDAYEAGGTGVFDDPDGAGVDAWRLPPIDRAHAVAGSVTRAATAATGLRTGTPVVTGTGDWMATLIGSAAVLPDRICVYLGTAGAAGAFVDRASADALTGSRCFAAATATGSALAWVGRLVGTGPGDFDALTRLADRSPAGAQGVTFLPHLMGERGDGHRPDARAALLGLTLAHGPADVVRAVLEGTALWLRAIAGTDLDRHPTAEVLAVGGGARSDLWLRILAAVLDRDLAVAAVTEARLLGTALLAAAGTGLVTDLPSTRDSWVRVARVVPADPDLVKTYDQSYRDLLTAEHHLGTAPPPAVSSRLVAE